MSVSDSPITSLRASYVRPIRRREITHAASWPPISARLGRSRYAALINQFRNSSRTASHTNCAALEPTERKFAVDDASQWQLRLGAAEAGRYADLIAVIGDPLADLSVLTSVRFVMKEGAVVKKP